jgi:hypothetical protein
MEAPLLLQARAAIASESLRGKKVCRLTKWLISTQNKLRTAINRSSTSSVTSRNKNKNKICCSSPTKNSIKSTQHRRIHNEIFGWTSDAWDEEMSLLSASASASASASKTHSSMVPTTPQTGFMMSRQEALRRADDYTIRRIENAVSQNTIREPCDRRGYFRVDGY